VQKISVSIPEDILEFVDRQSPNRSRAIVTILQEYKRKKQEAELGKAYEDYEEFCQEDDRKWWPEWEASSAGDIEKRRNK
jgi:hypothetical protein